MEHGPNSPASRSTIQTLSVEWLESDGTGGYSMSTLACANTRRHHGLLVLPDAHTMERYVLLSRLDERLALAGTSHELATNFYPDGVIHPQGFNSLHSFTHLPHPTWRYQFGEQVVLQKSLLMLHGLNAVVLRYELLESPSVAILELTPILAGRSYHGVTRENGAVSKNLHQHEGWWYINPYIGIPGVKFLPGDAPWHSAPDWYRRTRYPADEERGFSEQEDLFSPGRFSVPLLRGKVFEIVIASSTSKFSYTSAMWDAEISRREQLCAQLPVRNATTEQLALAADKFLISRGGNPLVIAGYPWFTVWGRDAMLSLAGLTLASGRAPLGRKIWESFAAKLSEGMILNLLPDRSTSPLYNTIDATLWWIIAGYQYLEESNDREFARQQLLPAVREVYRWYTAGTRYGIHRDSDDLLITGGSAQTQLTWMDAQVHGSPVTPRWGKAVEINALWINLLEILLELERSGILEGQTGAEIPRLEIELVVTRRAFLRAFWQSERGYFADVVRPDFTDTALRPNQIFALSLPFEAVTAPVAALALRTIEDQLLTPVGLRSLAPNDPAYCGRYQGSPEQRDAVYHQGTAWGFLLGPFITALRRYGAGDTRKRARQLIASALEQRPQGVLGSVAEIFDGDAPHEPRGCPAQAWSVAELLRVAVELDRHSETPSATKQPWRVQPHQSQRHT